MNLLQSRSGLTLAVCWAQFCCIWYHCELTRSDGAEALSVAKESCPLPWCCVSSRLLMKALFSCRPLISGLHRSGLQMTQTMVSDSTVHG